jgi:hypothetical protein
MAMPRIVLAHAADTKALAEIAARRLTGLGMTVERQPLETLNGAADEADRVIVLWSRGAAPAAASLRRAEASGKLCVARLASAPTPPRLRAHVAALPRPRDSDAAWLALAGAPTAASAPSKPEPNAYPGSRWHALLVAALMAAIFSAALAF